MHPSAMVPELMQSFNFLGSLWTSYSLHKDGAFLQYHPRELPQFCACPVSCCQMLAVGGLKGTYPNNLQASNLQAREQGCSQG